MLRKNTASQHLGFVLVKAADGTALTGATVTAYRSIDGAAQAAVTGAVTELANGQYSFAPSQADTNGNQVSYLFTAVAAVPIEKTVVTTAADPTDATRFGLSALPNAAANANGGIPVLSSSGTTLAYTITTATGLTNLPSVPTDWLAAAGVKADAVTKIQNGLSTYAGGPVASVTAPVTVADGSITSAKFTVSAPSAGLPTGILEKIDRVFRRFFGKADRTPTQLKTYADDSVTVLTTQTVSDDGAGNESQGAAS